MLTDNIDAALAELERALDPDALATDVLRQTGEDSNAYNARVGPWEDQTGRLRDAFTFELEGGSTVHVLTEVNEMPYAPYVEALQGYSVLTSWVDGAVMDILRAAFQRHERRDTL